MATLYNEGDRYSLTKLDVQILIALLKGQSNGYELARQCEIDNKGSDHIVNINAVQYSLKGMNALLLIQELEGRKKGPGRSSRTFRITSIGKEVLRWEADAMAHRLELYKSRS